MNKVQNNINLGPHKKYPKSVKAGIPKLQPLKQGWRRVTIGELFKVAIRPAKMSDEQTYDLVTVKRSRGGVVKRESLLGRDISVKSQFFINEDDFLISKRQIVHGACGFVPDELDGSLVSNEYSVLKCSEIILPSFLNQLIHSNYFQRTCFHSSTGVHVEKMIFKLETWFAFKINIPNIKEQHKIANFLTAIDQRITLLKLKKAALEQYKKGLMQKIFNQEIRFKNDEGNDFPEWEEFKLEKVGKIVTGKTPKSNDLYLWNDELDFVTPTDIIDGKKYQLSVARRVTRTSKLKIIPKNSILYTCIASIGKMSLSVNECITNQQINSLIPKKQYDNEYIYYSLLYLTPRIKALQANTTLPIINKTEFSKIKVSIPCIDEQQKIANFLSATDKKITAMDKQITETESFKKGLLQRMFV